MLAQIPTRCCGPVSFDVRPRTRWLLDLPVMEIPTKTTMEKQTKSGWARLDKHRLLEKKMTPPAGAYQVQVVSRANHLRRLQLAH